MNASTRALLLAASALTLVACNPDRPDVYSAPAAPEATLPPLPTTIAPVEGEVVPEPISFEANGIVVDVRSLDNSFIQPTVEVVAGTEINWINGGRNDHNVLPVDEALAWGVERDVFVPGARYSRVFDEPGVFAYYCSIHGTKEAGMVGAIIVTEPS